MVIAYLTPLTINPGQFSDEFAVSLRNYQGSITSGFFPTEKLLGRKLEVTILETKGDVALIEVPGQLLNGPDSAGAGKYMSVNLKSITF